MDAKRGEAPGAEERCSNPWRGGEGCGRADICVYIQRRGGKLPICHSCWDWILTHNKKW